LGGNHIALGVPSEQTEGFVGLDGIEVRVEYGQERFPAFPIALVYRLQLLQ
jgi:hypothetical protein